MGPMSCPETSVTNYQSMLRNIPEERMFLSCHLFGVIPNVGNINGSCYKGKKSKGKAHPRTGHEGPDME